MVVAGGAGWGGGADGPGLGVGGLEPLAEGLGGVGGAEALDRIAEEGLPCRLWHDGLRGGLVGVGGGAGAYLLEGMHNVQPIMPSRSPGPLLGSNRIVWLCDQEPMKSFQKGPPPEKAKLKRWWTYLSQFRLTVHHIPGIKKELSDYISRNNFDALKGESSEALAKEAFQRMDVQLDLSMRTAGILEGWSLTDYQSQY